MLLILNYPILADISYIYGKHGNVWAVSMLIILMILFVGNRWLLYSCSCHNELTKQIAITICLVPY